MKDLVVLELASVLAGPGVGQFFAELGAEVIKVENVKTSGDVTRSWKAADEDTDDRSAYFCSVNWGKQSIALDLTTSEGREIAYRLARRSHVVITSYKPGDAERLGVDYASLSSDHPGLIYGQITGYGSDNHRVGYDAVIQAETGFISMNGEPGGPSLKMPVALIDILAGHQLKEGLLLALLEKQRTGKGKLVEVSLIEAAVSSLANQASSYLNTGKIPQKQGSAHPNIAPYGDVFRTRDGREILLAVGTDQQFAQLVKILKISEIIKDLPFETNHARVRNRVVLNDLLSDTIGQFKADELLAKLHGENIPAGVIRDVGAALSDVQIQRIIMEEGPVKGVRAYVGRSPDSRSSHLLPPPHLGEHTMAILQQLLKISPSDVKSLAERGVIH